jgi:hypothetical protein
LKLTKRSSEIASVTSVAPTAVHRTASRPLAKSVTIAPTPGRKISSVSRLF